MKSFAGALVVLTAQASPLEPVLRVGNVPFGVMNALFGTSMSPFGGINLPLDSRLLAMFSRPPFLTGGAIPPANNSFCHEFWRTNAAWSTRAVGKILSQEEGRLSYAADDPYISLVDDPEELADLSPDQFACLFYLGYAPPRIPSGVAPGRVYYVLGNELINDLSEIFWGGKVFLNATCTRDGDIIHFSVNQAFRAPAAWAELYIATNPRKESIGIYYEDYVDDEPSMFVDYGADFETLCPALLPRLYDAGAGEAPSLVSRLKNFVPSRNSLAHEFLRAASARRPLMPNLVGGSGALFAPGQTNLGMFDNAWPLRDVIDQLRWVGRDERYGADIYLGRALYLFPEGGRTVAWFSIKTPEMFQQPPVIHALR